MVQGRQQKNCQRNLRVRLRRTAAASLCLCVLLAVAALFGGCGSVATQPGIALASDVPVSSIALSRGDTLKIVGTEGAYCKVEYSGDSGSARANGRGISMLLVEKWLVRPASEATPEAQVAYATSDAALYASAYFDEEIAILNENDKLEVLDSFSACAFVKTESGMQGYLPASSLLAEPISHDGQDGFPYYGYADSYGHASGGSGGSDGSGSGGSSGSGGWSGGAIDTGTGEGLDGEDIVLASSKVIRSAFVKTAYADEVGTAAGEIESYTGEATVLSDRTQTYLAFLDRGDAVNIVKEKGDNNSASSESGEAAPAKATVRLLINGQIGEVPSCLVRADSEPAFQKWSGYAVEKAGLFSSYQLIGEIKSCELNEQVSVEDDLGTCYFVTIGDASGYMHKEDVSDSEIEVSGKGAVGYYGYRSGNSNDNGSGSGGKEAYSSGGYADAGNSGSASSIIEKATGGWTEERL